MMAVGAGALVLATLASAATNLISSGTFEGSGCNEVPVRVPTFEPLQAVVSAGYQSGNTGTRRHGDPVWPRHGVLIFLAIH